jgi:hypothetical protein
VTSAVWPNLFVVGAARAGTTSLWRHLDMHPEIWMSPIKEPSFFSGVQRRLAPTIGDKASYLRLFAPGARYRYRGEASPSYLWHPEAAEAIKRVSPEATIVISLRDPVDRAYSSYLHAVGHGEEERPFPQAVRDELDDPSSQDSRYVRSSFYADSVSRYLDVFTGAVHVLFFEELVADLHGELRRIVEFVGVDGDAVQRTDDTARNSFGLPRNRVVGRVLNSPWPRAAARLVLPLSVRLRLEDRLLKRPSRPPMEPETKELLTAEFAPDVERLRAILGRVPWARYAGEPAGARESG